MQFDQQSPYYEQHARVQRALIAWGVSELGDYAHSRVLEFGAGTGLLTREWLRRGACVCATDLAEGMVREGQKNCPDAHWMQLDAWEPRAVQGAPFDLVASSALLQWAPDAQAVFARWKDLVKPEGELFALLFVEPSLPELREVCPEALPFQWLTTEHWLSACEGGGWSLQDSCQQKVSFVYPNTLELLRSLHGIGATEKNRLGVGRMRRLLKDYEARYAREQGTVRASWTFLKIRAKKLV